MPRFFKTLLLLLSIQLMIGCAGRGKTDLDDPIERFAKGESLFEKEKWLRASEHFNWVVLNNPAGNLAAEAQYYYAECVYQQEQYVEAQLEFERLLRRWAGSKHRIEARYRIALCLVSQSPTYHHDQTSTIDAIDELQAYIEDFPDSDRRQDTEELITQMRLKLAQKHYESGRQYLKWRRNTSARLYFAMVLEQFYDTPFADQARVGYVVSYLLEDDPVAAEEYLSLEKERFDDDQQWEEARGYIERARMDKFDFALFKRLYK